MTEVLELDTSFPGWVDKNLEKIVAKYSEKEFTNENLTEMRKDLSKIGLENMIHK